MKVAEIALVLLLVAVLTITGVGLANLAKANPEAYGWSSPPRIFVYSPIGNSTVLPSAISLNFTITKPETGWLTSYEVPSNPEIVLENRLSYVTIIIDNRLFRTIEANNSLSSPFKSYQPLLNLQEGLHNLTINAYCEGWELEVHGLWEKSLPYNVSSDFIEFTVDTTPPTITNVSLKNKTYPLSEIPLVFSLDETTSQISYSLDGQANVTISGNTTLGGLTAGHHVIVIYADDCLGNTGRSDSMNFTVVKESEPNPESFPILLVVFPVTCLAIVFAGLFIYLTKNKDKKKELKE